jgi:hypothetical protein
MRVQLGDTTTTHDLANFLRSRIDAIVEEGSRGELEVSLLGSYGDTAMKEEIALAVRRWSFVRQQPEPVARID